MRDRALLKQERRQNRAIAGRREKPAIILGETHLRMTMIALAALTAIASAGYAQADDNSMNNSKSPGTTGAMKTPTAPGVATDPQGVAAQQGNSAKASAGTVGAAPGASTQSQMPQDKSKQ